MTLQRWEPWSDLRRMGETMNRFWKRIPESEEDFESWGIPLDVIDEPHNIIVKASIPSVKPEDIKVTVEDGVLTIEGESKSEHEEKNKNFLMHERAYGSFYRALRLPRSVDQDKVQTSYENGVLKLTFDKMESKKAKQIKINVGEGSKFEESKK